MGQDHGERSEGPQRGVGEAQSRRGEGLAVSERRAKVQGDQYASFDWPDREDRDGSVPWSVHESAWKDYARVYGGAQTAERINERGGFGYREIQCALAGDSERSRCVEKHPPVPGWEPRSGGT